MKSTRFEKNVGNVGISSDSYIIVIFSKVFYLRAGITYPILQLPTLPTPISRFIAFIFLNLRTFFVHKISN